MSFHPPDHDGLALMRAYAGNMTERQLRRILVERKSFEDWAIEIYEQALAKKLAGKKQSRPPQPQRQRDRLGRYRASPVTRHV